MKMQDNEFDELFRSKWDDFEVQPSADVWNGIAEELNAGRRKRVLMPLFSVAASILVLVVAGIWFIPQKVKVNGKSQIQNSLVKTDAPINNDAKANNKIKPAILQPNHSVKVNGNFVAVNKAYPVKVTRYTVAKNAGNITKLKELDKQEEQPVLAANVTEPKEAINAVVPDDRTPLAIKDSAEQPSSFITKPTLAAVQILPVNKADPAPARQKHRMRTLGDLINIAVAKVDKRKDKFIEFTNTDDGESNITGINLGIVKFKKEK
jgi:hypothetical protein